MHLSLSLLQYLILCVLWDIHQVYKTWVMRISKNLRLPFMILFDIFIQQWCMQHMKQCNVKRQMLPYSPYLFYHTSIWQWGSLRHSGPEIPNSIYILRSPGDFKIFRSNELPAKISRQLFFKSNISASA